MAKTKKGGKETDEPVEIVPDTEVGNTCELRIRQQRYNSKGDAEDTVVDTLKLPRGHGADKAFAVVVHQIFTKKNRLEKEILTINSEHLLQAFLKVIGSYPTVAADFSDPFELESPFQMLYHYWDDLDVYREEIKDDVARMHLNLLFDFMEQTMGPEKKKCETQVKKGQSDYSRLWTLYRPGDIQIRHEHGHPWLMKCTKTAYEENTKVGKWFEVHCVFSDFDGSNEGQARIITKIYQKEHFAAENPAVIKDLPIFPRKFVTEGNSLEERLKERSERFLSIKEVCVRQYDGIASHVKRPPMRFFHPSMADFDTIWWPYKETGRVVIDRKTFQEDERLSSVSVDPTKPIDKRLCPPYVYGYSLSLKEWCRFYLDHIQEVEWNKKCMDSLVMNEDQKLLLKALVTSHSFPENPRDYAKQKGKGLVVLLHGAPGSGKTLTAETSAEITERALFSTSLAELNKENFAWFFEHRLVQVLQYATIWKAVVLFDEADVFLEARKDDVADAAERNGLVAVFLRHLEYFSGIVFLTTNRIEVFDEAMKSRVHLALGYNPPELEMRKRLWIKSLTGAIGDLDDELEQALERLTRIKLNGREISNAINTAQTLARFEGKILQLKHIDTVLNVKHEFDMGMRKMAKSQGSTGTLIQRGSILGSAMSPMVDEPEEV